MEPQTTRDATFTVPGKDMDRMQAAYTPYCTALRRFLDAQGAEKARCLRELAAARRELADAYGDAARRLTGPEPLWTALFTVADQMRDQADNDEHVAGLLDQRAEHNTAQDTTGSEGGGES